ncbi:MAG: diguanylate cyclase, partial [Haliea sp.]
LSLVYAVFWRDALPLVYACHVFMAGLTHLSLAGLAGEYLWPNSPWWSDRAPGILAVLAMALLHLFVREMVAERGSRWLTRLLVTMVVIGGAIAVGFLQFGRALYVVSSTYYLVSFALLIGVSFWFSRRNPVLGYWVLSAISVLAFCASFTILRNLDVLPLMPLTQYGAQVGLFLEISLLFVALHRHNREKRGNRTRVHDMGRVDPLTGAASHRVMLQRLQQLIRRQRRDPSTGAVIRVRLSNAVEIRQEYGMEAAQNAVVHAGACINSLLKEGDSIARHRDGDFLILLGGRASRDDLAEFGQRLIARGLHTSSRMPSHTVLQLKLAIAHAPLSLVGGEQLLQSLGAALNDLCARPGKALRFVD